MLLSGYNPTTVIRSHEERLDAMRASRTIPGVNRAAQESGRLGSDARSSESYIAGMQSRMEAETVQPSRDIVATLAAQSRERGFTATAFRLGIGTATLKRILHGKRVRVGIMDKIATKLAMPAPQPRWAVASPALITRLRRILGEEGSYKSTAARLGVGFSMLQKVLSGERTTASAVERLEEQSRKPKPAGWKTGLERLQEHREARRVRMNAVVTARVKKANAARASRAEMNVPLVCPNHIVEQLNDIVEAMGPLKASAHVGISYNCLRRLRTQVPVLPSTILSVEQRLESTRRAA